MTSNRERAKERKTEENVFISSSPTPYHASRLIMCRCASQYVTQYR